MPGPLWPGGPAELPAVIELGGQRYTVPAVPGLRLAWAVTRFLPIVPELLAPDDRAEVHRRLRQATDLLDREDTVQATVQLVADLAGIDSGVNGWRAAVRLCGALVADWPYTAGALMGGGLQPASAPLWQLCAAMYYQFIDNPGADDAAVKRAKQELFAPLRGEPAWMRPVKPPPPIKPAQARAGAMALFQQATGRMPDLPPPCRECGQRTGHAQGCVRAPDAAVSP